MPDKEKANYRLPKAALLSKPEEFQAVYRNGKRLRGIEFSLIFIPNGLQINRLGISVHGVKKAVQRNRIKRIIREFYRLNRQFISPPSDIVIAVRSGFPPSSPQDVDRVVKPLLARLPPVSS